MYTAEMANAITQTSWFDILYNLSSNWTDSNFSSKLEIAVLLESGASISVPIIPTYILITQMCNVCIYEQYDTSEKLKNGNQFEIPNKRYTSVFGFSSMETNSKYFMIPFAVDVIRCNMLVTSFFEKYTQNINFQVCMNFKHSLDIEATIASFTTLIKKNFFFFSYFIK